MMLWWCGNVLVQALIVEEGARVMSLTDGKSKMSKSDPADGSRINLTDPPDVIAKKVWMDIRGCLRISLAPVVRN